MSTPNIISTYSLRQKDKLVHWTQENKKVLRRMEYFSLIRHVLHKNDASNNSSILACVRCLGNIFTEPLPNNDRRYKHRHKDWWEGLMKRAVFRGSGAMMYITSFIKTDLGIHKLIEWGDTERHSQQDNLRSLL